MECAVGYDSPRWSGEIADCSLPMTFDTYSNCSFGCVYCFSQFQRGIGASADDYAAKRVKCVDVQKVKDIVDFYKRNSVGSGYLRLNRKVKEPYVRKMMGLCHDLGMRFYVSDAHFKECCDNACCCGLPDDWKISRCQFSNALQICKREGTVTWSQIAGDADFLDFEWRKAEGFNTSSVERRAKFDGMSMKDYLRYLWNNPKAGQSPYHMFEGVMIPDGTDADGNVVYRYNQGKTFVRGGSTEA